MLAAVWVAHMFASTIHEARHARDTMTITGSARKPITSNLVRWSLTVGGVSRTPQAAAHIMRRDMRTVEAFLRSGGVPTSAMTESVVQSETIVTRISKKSGLVRFALGFFVLVRFGSEVFVFLMAN